MKTKDTKLMLCLAAALAAGACSQIEINEQVSQSPYSGLTFQFQWEDDPAVPQGDMLLIMNRIQYTRHYVETLDAAGQPVSGGSATPAARFLAGTEGDGQTGTPSRPETPVQPDEDAQDGTFVGGKYQVKAGEYNLCSLSVPQEGVEITNLESFKNDNSIAYNSLNLTLPEQELSDLKELRLENDSVIQWIDLNPGTPYVTNIAPIYGEMQNNLMINSGSDRVISFVPRTLTQHIVIPFRLTIEDSVTVTRAIAELSGIVMSSNLSSQTLDCKNTGRIIFLPQLVKREGNLLYYEGSFDVLGAVASPSAAYSVGPGILQLAIYAEAEDEGSTGTGDETGTESETETKKEKKKKIFRTTRNLHEAMTEIRLIDYEEETESYRLATKEARLNTDLQFNITREQITAESEDGVVNWDDDNEIEGEM